jgi:hypothetical protein
MLTGHEQTCTEGGINVTGKNPRCQNLFPYFAVTRHKTGTYYPFEINQMEIIMFKLTTPTSLPLLNLPASALEALSNEILGPVDDIDLFTDFWNETGTLLWHLNHDDTLPEDPLLTVALANPEYVTALDDGWYLLLGIVCDNGQGIYLVFPDSTVITQLQNLIEALNHE